MEPIQFEFSLNKDDYLQGIWTFYRHDRSTWLLVGVFIILLLPGFYLFAQSGYRNVSTFLVPLVFILGLLIFYLYLQPLMAARRMSKDKRMTSLLTYQVDQETIWVQSPYGESKFDWGDFRKEFESKGHFILVYSAKKRLFQVIPKRAFKDNGQETAFRELLYRKIPG